MKTWQGIISEDMPGLYKPKEFVVCPYCNEKLSPGLMNIAKHWTVCPDNPIQHERMKMETPLIDELKKIVK